MTTALATRVVTPLQPTTSQLALQTNERWLLCWRTPHGTRQS